jgi:hypothetical protein
LCIYFIFEAVEVVYGDGGGGGQLSNESESGGNLKYVSEFSRGLIKNLGVHGYIPLTGLFFYLQYTARHMQKNEAMSAAVSFLTCDRNFRIPGM